MSTTEQEEYYVQISGLTAVTGKRGVKAVVRRCRAKPTACADTLRAYSVGTNLQFAVGRAHTDARGKPLNCLISH